MPFILDSPSPTPSARSIETVEQHAADSVTDITPTQLEMTTGTNLTDADTRTDIADGESGSRIFFPTSNLPSSAEAEAEAGGPVERPWGDLDRVLIHWSSRRGITTIAQREGIPISTFRLPNIIELGDTVLSEGLILDAEQKLVSELATRGRVLDFSTGIVSDLVSMDSGGSRTRNGHENVGAGVNDEVAEDVGGDKVKGEGVDPIDTCSEAACLGSEDEEILTDLGDVTAPT